MKWTKDQEELLRSCIEQKWLHKEIANELDRTILSIRRKAEQMSLKSTHGKVLTNIEFDKRIKNKNFLRIDNYINARTKIKFKCLGCSNNWLAEPRSILEGRGCPYCAIGSFKTYLPGATYCIYFKELDLYKIGISNNYKKRFIDFWYTPEIVFIREFENGKNAKELETRWLQNIKDYKINTGLLKSGNTETFRYGN